MDFQKTVSIVDHLSICISKATQIQKLYLTTYPKEFCPSDICQEVGKPNLAPPASLPEQLIDSLELIFQQALECVAPAAGLEDSGRN